MIFVLSCYMTMTMFSSVVALRLSSDVALRPCLLQLRQLYNLVSRDIEGGTGDGERSFGRTAAMSRRGRVGGRSQERGRGRRGRPPMPRGRGRGGRYPQRAGRAAGRGEATTEGKVQEFVDGGISDVQGDGGTGNMPADDGLNGVLNGGLNGDLNGSRNHRGRRSGQVGRGSEPGGGLTGTGYQHWSESPATHALT